MFVLGLLCACLGFGWLFRVFCGLNFEFLFCLGVGIYFLVVLDFVFRFCLFVWFDFLVLFCLGLADGYFSWCLI